MTSLRPLFMIRTAGGGEGHPVGSLIASPLKTAPEAFIRNRSVAAAPSTGGAIVGIKSRVLSVDANGRPVALFGVR